MRIGDLAEFQATLSRHSVLFMADKTYTLIVRLRQNVIKAGVRRLSLSYSRISLRDICIKLHLDSEEDAEYIVGKAIRDGVIEGRLIHEKGWMECGGGKGGYGPEVAEAFGRRIDFCLELHNESIKVRLFNFHSLVGLTGRLTTTLTILRRCDTRSMPTAKIWRRPRERENVRRSLQRRFRTALWKKRRGTFSYRHCCMAVFSHDFTG